MVCWLFVGSAVFTVLGGQSLGEKWVLSFNLTHIQFMIVLQAIIFIAGCRSRVDRDLIMFVPIFMPLLIRLDVTPQTVLAAYRVADSPLNVVTPLMAYFPLIVVFVQRYNRHAGIGTVVSLMLPYVIFLSIAWTLFFVAWYLLGIPWGPGAPVHP